MSLSNDWSAIAPPLLLVWVRHPVYCKYETLSTNLLNARLLGLLQKFDLQLKHSEARPSHRCHVIRTLARNGQDGNKAIPEPRMMVNYLNRTRIRPSVIALDHVLTVVKLLYAVVSNSEIRNPKTKHHQKGTFEVKQSC